MTNRTKTLTLRLTEEELARIERRAGYNYLNAASWVRQFVLTELDDLERYDRELTEREQERSDQLDDLLQQTLTPDPKTVKMTIDRPILARTDEQGNINYVVGPGDDGYEEEYRRYAESKKFSYQESDEKLLEIAKQGGVTLVPWSY